MVPSQTTEPAQTEIGGVGAAQWVPTGAGIDGLRAASRACQGCELHKGGPHSSVQTVFSKGVAPARVVFVGEQPGDQEDKQGFPFVGPAGQLLDRAMAEAGIDPRQAYVTNSVKHFRFTQSSPQQRRIHKTPEAPHLAACRPWLMAELAVLDPEVIVVLGATAGRALLGPAFRVTRQRGRLMPWPARTGEPGTRQNPYLLATVHPSAVLRADDPDAAYAAFRDDLAIAASVLR